MIQIEELEPQYAAIVQRDPLSSEYFHGYAITKGELAIQLMSRAIGMIRQLPGYADKPQSNIIEIDSLPHLIRRIDEHLPVGARMPLKGPSIIFKRESRNSFKMGDDFYLSGIINQIFTEKPDFDSGLQTTDQFEDTLDKTLAKYRLRGEFSIVPNLQDLEIRIEAEPHNYRFAIHWKKVDGTHQRFNQTLYPHSSSHDLRRTAHELADLICYSYSSAASSSSKLKNLEKSFHTLTDNMIKSVSFEVVSFIKDTKNIALDIRYEIIDDHLKSCFYHNLVHVGTKQDHLMGCIDSIQSIAKKQATRIKKTEITIDQAAALASLEFQTVPRKIKSIFSGEREVVNYENIWKIEDGHIRVSTNLSNGILYDNGIIRLGLADHNIPEAVITGLKGAPIEGLIDHPFLKGHTIKRIRRLKNHIAVYLDDRHLNEQQFDALVASKGRQLAA